MKTNFLKSYRRNRDRNRRYLYVFSALLIGALVFFIFRNPIISIVSPLWTGQNILAKSIKNSSQFFKDKNSLIKENNDLKEKMLLLDSLETSIRLYEETQVEMLDLFGRRGKSDFVAGGVIAHPPKTPYDILAIDVGENSGVKIGDLVYLPQGGALGKISEVGNSNSKVSLYTTSGLETSAYLERGDESVVLIGRGGGTFVSLLSKEIKVEVGDRIIFPGIKGDLIAVVEEVTLLPTDSTQKVWSRGVANFNNIRFVEIRK